MRLGSGEIIIYLSMRDTRSALHCLNGDVLMDWPSKSKKVNAGIFFVLCGWAMFQGCQKHISREIEGARTALGRGLLFLLGFCSGRRFKPPKWPRIVEYVHFF